MRETGATHIVHLAALLTTTARENPRAALDVNVQGTNNVFEAARALPEQVERVAWASSAAVYAPPANYGGDFVTESDLVYPDTLYGATKEYNEHQARVYYEDFGVSHVALRPTVAYGPYRETGGSAFLANIVEKPALGEPFSVDYGDQVIDWQHAATSRRRSARRRSRRRRPQPARLQRPRRPRDDPRGRERVRGSSRTPTSRSPTRANSRGRRTRHDRRRNRPRLRPEYDLESGFRDYINVLRKEHGLEPV